MLGRIENRWRDCADCSLCDSRRQVVIGAGPLSAQIVVVGEAPDAEDGESGVPFCGPSGRFLRDAMKDAGVEPDECYLTNILGCRPPENREPSRKEIGACLPRLSALLLAIRPSVVVAMGGVALKTLTGERSVFQARGRLLTSEVEFGRLSANFDTLATLLPSYVARKRDDALRKAMINDFIDAKRYIAELPF